MFNTQLNSDDVMEYAVRLSSSDADEPVSQQNVSQRVRSNSEESGADIQTEAKSQQREMHEQQPHSKVSHTKKINHKRKKPLTICKAKKLKRTKKKQTSQIPPEPRQRNKSAKTKTVIRRKKKKRMQAGPSAQFPTREPEITSLGVGARCLHVP